MDKDLVPHEVTALAPFESRVAAMIRQKEEIQHAMKAVMKEGEHYGIIPGTGKDKPSLLQPGADCLIFLFSFSTNYEIVTTTERDDLISYDVRCTLKSIDTDRKIGEGLGACNSREKRYQSQSSAKVCPECKQATIIKGKAEYGGGWLCFAKKGGCGKKWPDGAEEIELQEGKAQAAGVWDLKNTILKMACKRAKVAAVLTATAASDCFTQDLEDLVEAGVIYSSPKGQTVPSADSTAKTTPIAVGAGQGLSTSTVVVHDPETGEVLAELDDPNGFAEHVEVYQRMVENKERKSDPANAPKVPIFKWSDRNQRFEDNGFADKLTQEQNKMIHYLREKLGHHLDLRVNPPAHSRFDKEGKPVKAKNVPGGKYYKKLMELFGKESTDKLSVDEASRAIELLQGMVSKVYSRVDRGNPEVLGEKT